MFNAVTELSLKAFKRPYPIELRRFQNMLRMVNLRWSPLLTIAFRRWTAISAITIRGIFLSVTYSIQWFSFFFSLAFMAATQLQTLFTVLTSVTRRLTFLPTVSTFTLPVTYFCWRRRPFPSFRWWLYHCVGIRTFFRSLLIIWRRGALLMPICEIGLTVIKMLSRLKTHIFRQTFNLSD